MDQTFTFHTDGGHGWLEVPAELVRALHVQPTKFSYQDRTGAIFYLEEDRDAPAFSEAFKTAYGHHPYYTEINHDDEAFIRFLPRIINGGKK